MPARDDASPSSPGRLIGDRYRLESKLGEGAMGSVWYGIDELLRRAVAIKEIHLPPGMPEEEAAEIRERALREARAIALVTHPNVVTLYDVAREQGEPFVVMELVPSQSLAAVLGEHGALDDAQVALIADGVAAALQAAHQNGVIHRDVKPGNVLLGETGQVKLSDFGISRNIAEPTITRTGIMLGTPAFIAPEIATGDRITPNADLWGLGATLFAASEGRPPYNTEDSPLATVTSVVRDPVPVPTRGDVLGEVITGLMVKDPAQRMPSHEVRRRIQPLLPTSARPFDLLLDPEAPTVRVRRPTDVDTRGAAEPSAEPPAPQLASDPGPLPFMLRESAPPKRRVLPSIALGLAAVLVFAAAAVGGFAGSRVLAGAPLLPDTRPGAQQPELVTKVGFAEHTGADGRGQFRISLPPGWTTFHDERDDLTNSLSVHYVSPDGRFELTVQRFGEFYRDGYTAEDYRQAREQYLSAPRNTYTQGGVTQVGQPDPYSLETDQRLRYRTTRSDEPDGAPYVRGTVEQLMPRGGDLWVVRVTSPDTRSQQRTRLFERAVDTFSPLPR